MDKHVIIVDADYIDRVAFNLIVNFERMLERRIPQADLARWMECVVGSTLTTLALVLAIDRLKYKKN